MATIAVTKDSATVRITSISPVNSILTNMSESVFANAFSVVTTNKQPESLTINLSNGIALMPTYAKTDGVPITSTSQSSGGTYWVTG